MSDQNDTPASAERDELAPAVADVAYQLTHDPSDTKKDVRDALAFAPLAIAIALNRTAAFMARRRGLMATAALGAVAGAVLIARRRRR